MKALAQNKRARFDYEILETIEAGLVLLGHEVKSAKAGRIDLSGSFVHFRESAAWLTNATIAPYAKARLISEYDPTRGRKLLLKKKDLERLRRKRDIDRLTVIPLRAYTNRGLVKIEIALAKGKRKFEKREAIKKRDDARRIRSAKMHT
jgi:SsrA-binding protein